jgi:hypothetical protein
MGLVTPALLTSFDVGHDDCFSSSSLVLGSVFLSLVLVLIVLSSQDRLGIQLFCHSIRDYWQYHEALVMSLSNCT